MIESSAARGIFGVAAVGFLLVGLAHAIAGPQARRIDALLFLLPLGASFAAMASIRTVPRGRIGGAETTTVTVGGEALRGLRLHAAPARLAAFATTRAAGIVVLLGLIVRPTGTWAHRVVGAILLLLLLVRQEVPPRLPRSLGGRRAISLTEHYLVLDGGRTVVPWDALRHTSLLSTRMRTPYFNLTVHFNDLMRLDVRECADLRVPSLTRALLSLNRRPEARVAISLGDLSADSELVAAAIARLLARPAERRLLTTEDPEVLRGLAARGRANFAP